MIINTDQINAYIEEKYSSFGDNKRFQISRLIYEIVKREDKCLEDVIESIPQDLNFEKLKKYLIARRNPRLNSRHKLKDFYLGKLDIKSEHKVDLTLRRTSPKYIYVEESVKESSLFKRVQNFFPKAESRVITRYSEHIKNKPYSFSQYNKRLEEFYIVREDFDFFKKCPCSPKSVSCGYHIINLGSGCAFDCSYCYLQGFLNSPGIVLPANIDDFFVEFTKYKQNIRVGSGEYTDSLIFDHITEYSPKIVEFFSQYPKSQFEFKTKSNNIDLLLKAKPIGNIVVSWTVNTPRICRDVEHLTASLEERLEAAVKCMNAGYLLGFHFDPIFYYEGWKEEYRDLVYQIHKVIDTKRIAWVSLGTLRMTPLLRKSIENRFPDNKILDEEMILGLDKKIRYDQRTRMDIYTYMTSLIKSFDKDTNIYLCMEEKSICNSCQSFPFKK